MTVLYPPFACVCSHFVKTPFCDKQIRKNRKVFSMHSLPLVCINELTSPYKKPSVVLTRREAQKRAGIQELKYRKGCRPSCHLWILNGLSHNSLYMHVSILRVYCTRSYTRVIQKGSVQSVIWWSHFPGYVKGLSCLWKFVNLYGLGPREPRKTLLTFTVLSIPSLITDFLCRQRIRESWVKILLLSHLTWTLTATLTENLIWRWYLKAKWQH